MIIITPQNPPPPEKKKRITFVLWKQGDHLALAIWLEQIPFHSQSGIRYRMLLCSERQWEPMECRNISYNKMQSVDYQETLFAKEVIITHSPLMCLICRGLISPLMLTELPNTPASKGCHPHI